MHFMEEPPRWCSGKESACQAEDAGSIPGSGRSPGERNGSPLQYFCLENPTDRGAWHATVLGVAKSQTWFSDWARTHAFYRFFSALLAKVACHTVMSEEARVATDACWLLPLCCSPRHHTQHTCTVKSAPTFHPVQGNSCYCDNRGFSAGSFQKQKGRGMGQHDLSFLPLPGDLGSTGPDNDSQKQLQIFQRDFQNIWAFATLWQSSGHQMRRWEEEEWEMTHNPMLNGFLLKSVSHWNSQKKI